MRISNLPRKSLKAFTNWTGRRWNNTVGISSASYRSALPFNEIPGPPGLPYLGTVHKYMLGALNKYEYSQIIIENFQKYGAIFKETLAGQTRVHICLPDMIRVVYENEGKYPSIVPLVEPNEEFRKETEMSLGLGNSNGEQWYQLRTVVQKYMLRPAEVASYLPQTNEVSNDFVLKLLENEYRDDFLNFSCRWTLETGGYNSFGKRLGYLEDGSESEKEVKKIIQMNDDIFTLSTSIKFSVPSPVYKYGSQYYKKLFRAEDFVTNVTQNHLEQTLQRIDTLVHNKETNNTSHNVMKEKFILSLLSSKKLSMNDIRVTAQSLFLDGLRTTVPTMISTLYCLANSQEKQAALFREVNSVLGERLQVTAKDISSLVYLKACIKEAIRLHPVSLEVVRVNEKDIALGGFQIPAGSTIELNNFALFRDSSYFKDPDSFIPERWLRGSKNCVSDPFIFIPFGRGPRMCDGRRFAEQDMYVLISKLIQTFRIHWNGQEYDHDFKILQYPKKETPFMFEPR